MCVNEVIGHIFNYFTVIKYRWFSETRCSPQIRVHITDDNNIDAIKLVELD